MDLTGADALSIGGLAITLALLALNLRGWWKGSKKPVDLLPFTGGFAVGALWTACAGGFFGWSGGLIAAGTNIAGGGAIERGTGTDDGTVASAPLVSLTPGGAVMVLVVTAAGAAALKAAGKADSRRMIGGLICGASMTLTAGAATIASSLIIPAANMPGDTIVAWFGGAA